MPQAQGISGCVAKYGCDLRARHHRDGVKDNSKSSQWSLGNQFLQLPDRSKLLQNQALVAGCPKGATAFSPLFICLSHLLMRLLQYCTLLSAHTREKPMCAVNELMNGSVHLRLSLTVSHQHARIFCAK